MFIHRKVPTGPMAGDVVQITAHKDGKLTLSFFRTTPKKARLQWNGVSRDLELDDLAAFYVTVQVFEHTHYLYFFLTHLDGKRIPEATIGAIQEMRAKSKRWRYVLLGRDPAISKLINKDLSKLVLPKKKRKA